jgi:hypothetical protein
MANKQKQRRKRCAQCNVLCFPRKDDTCEACDIQRRGRSAEPDVPGALVFWRVRSSDVFSTFPSEMGYFSDLGLAESHYEQLVEVTGRDGEDMRRFDYWLEKVEISPKPNWLSVLNGQVKILRKIVLRCTQSEDKK